MQERIIQFTNWKPSRNISLIPGEKHELKFENDFPMTVNCTRFNYNYHLLPNYHDYFEITYVYHGNARVLFQNREYEIRTGDLVIVGNDIIHTFEPCSTAPTEMVWIAFLPKLVYAPGDSEIDFEYLKPFYENHNNFLITAENVDDSIPYALSAMYSLFEEKPLHYKVLLKTHLYGILSKLLLYYDKYEKSSEIVYGKKLNEADRIKQVFNLISEKYCTKITLDDAAERANMSTHYFCKFFKKVTGYTFLEYLLRARIDKAKELILSDKKSISEIAYSVGFENLSYFYRVFKRFTHMNPGDYYIGQHVS